MIQIGGHPGMRVMRSERGIMKVAETPDEAAALEREAAALRIMAGNFAPMLYTEGPAGILEADVGDRQPVRPDDGPTVRRDFVRMLVAIRKAGLRHGDLTAGNIIWDGRQISAVDWADSHPLGSDSPTEKHTATDAYLAMQALIDMGDTTRLGARWRAILESLGAAHSFGLPLTGRTLIDYGAHEGAFLGLAAAEGMHVTGVDRDPVVVRAEHYTGVDLGTMALHTDDLAHWHFGPRYSVALMLSVWPYIVADRGFDIAAAVLRGASATADVLFFETQLAGDGPGPQFLRSDRDVALMLAEVTGRVSVPLATIPVIGRDAERTLWQVGGPSAH